jgi:hypothetical protein
MEFSPNIGSYTEEFQQAVLLFDRHSGDTSQDGDVAQIGNLNGSNLVFSYFPKNSGGISKSHIRDLA